MPLRLLTTCDKNGRKSEPRLQFWNIYSMSWEDVQHVECKVWEEEAFATDINQPYYFGTDPDART